jgi:isopenicillin N synthase-like dioxygenase
MERFPIIDFAELQSRPEELGEEIIQACTKWGFMILKNYGISQDTVDRMFEMVCSSLSISWSLI